MRPMRTNLALAATCLLAAGCSNATQPFAFVPARRADPAPAVYLPCQSTCRTFWAMGWYS